MTRNKHMARKSLSIFLAVLMALTSMYAGLGVVASAVMSTLPGLGGTLAADTIYYVSGNTSVSANGSTTNGLLGPTSGTTVIYIAQGATLTVSGGAGNGTSAVGKAGILMRGGTLVIAGKGSLVVNGGKGGNGGTGGRGSDAGNYSGGNGSGGSGGAGGYGGGAGIGANGGASFSGTLSIANTVSVTKNNGDHGNAGSAGGGGNNGSYKDGCDNKTTYGGGGGGGGGYGGGGAAIGNGGSRGGTGGTGPSGNPGGTGSTGSAGGVGGNASYAADMGNAINGIYDFYKKVEDAIVVDGETLVPAKEAWKYSLAELVSPAFSADDLLALNTAATGGSENPYIYNGIKTTFSENLIKALTEDTFKSIYLTFVDSYLKDATQIKLVKEGVDTLLAYGANAKAFASMDAAEKKAERDAVLAANLNDGRYDTDALNTFYTTVNKAYNDITGVTGYEGYLQTMATEMGGDYATFSMDDSAAFIAIRKEALDMADLMNVKTALVAEYNKYNAKLADPAVSEDEIADEVLDSLPGKVSGFITEINKYKTKTFFSEVFTDEEYTEYTATFPARINFAIDYRNREEYYTNTYYSYFTNDKIFAAYGIWDNATIEQRYDQDYAKWNELKNRYNTDVAAFKEKYLQRGMDDAAAADAAQALAAEIYTLNFEGTDMLLQDAVEIYLNRLKTNIIYRNDTQIAKLASYAGNTTTVTLDNFMGIKGACESFDQTLYGFVRDKSWPIADPNGVVGNINTLLNNYNNFIATGGLNGFSQKHNHDGNGVFTTRYAGYSQTVDGNTVGYANDIARDGADDNYIVTEAKILNVINKLEAFLTSNEVGYLFADFDEPLDQVIMKMLADKLFTDDLVNTLVSALYPTLVDTFEGFWRDLPGDYNGTTIYYDKSLVDVLNALGIGIYPYQVANSMSNSMFTASAKNVMAGKTSWASLKNADDTWKFSWGLNDMSPDNYGTVTQYFNAKKDRFKAALSDVLNALLPVLRALFTNNGIGNHTINKFAHVKIVINVNVKVTFNLSGTPGYSTLVAPILEAFGITPLTQSESQSLNSTSAIVNAIIDPISNFVTGRFASAPVNTLLEVLPNLLYGLSFNRLKTLLSLIQTRLNYKVETNTLGIDLLDDGADVNLGSVLDLDTLIKDENENPIPLSDVNALIGHILKGFLPDAGLQLPVINGGKIIRSASLDRNASTRRSSAAGARINFTADKADEFYVILNWLVNALGDPDFVQGLLVALTKNAPSDEIKALVANIAGDTKAALAALVELIDPQTYDFMDYDWYESEYTYSEVDGIQQSDMPYLAYRNSWTRDKAQAIVDDADGVLSTVLEMAGMEDTSVNGLLQNLINDLFNNDGITSFVSLLTGFGALFDDSVTTDEETGVTTRTRNKFFDIIKRETGVEFQTWSNAFGYLFPEKFEGKNILVLQPGDEGYTNTTGVTASVTGEGEERKITWSLNGTPLEDGNRAQFVDMFCAVGAGMAPIVKLIFTGEDLSGFEGLITIKGYDTYKNSLGMLFEAIDFEGFEEFADEYDVSFMSAEDYATFANNNGAVAAFDELAQELSSWIDFMLEDNTVKKLLTILPNLVYFFESNGLGAALHNLLMPILVLLDVARPIIDVDINAILSYLLTALVNKKELDGASILGMLFGNTPAEPEEGDKVIAIDVNNLRFSDIIKLLDSIIGTDLYNSELVTYAIPAMCQARSAYNAANGKTGYKANVPAADGLTILLAGLIEALRHTNEDGVANKDLVGDFIVELTKTEENPDGSRAIPDFYDKLVALFHQEVTDLEDIHWDFMYDHEVTLDETFTLPAQTTQLLSTYLSYGNDWTKDLAAYIDENLDDIVKSALTAAGQDEDALTTILTNLINGTIYSDEVINAIIALLVKLVSGLKENLIDLLGVLLDIDIQTYYNYCEFEIDEETGKVLKVTCTKEWGVEDKATFIAAFKTAVTPLKRLASWLFLGDNYALGTGTEKDDDGNWTYNDLLVLLGGEGYAYGLVPILEAIGAHPAKPETFKDETGKYDIDLAIDSFLTTLTTALDGIIADPVNKLLELVPNLIYFLNSDGLKICLNNLTRPLDALVQTIDPSVGSLLGEINGIALNDLTTPNVLALIEQLTGLEFSEAEENIISSFYLGKAEYFESANGKPAFRLAFNDTSAEAYNGDRADMITLIVSLLVDMIKNNDGNAQKVDELLGTGTLVQQAVQAIGGMTVEYQTINWNYYVDGEGDNAADETNRAGITEGDITDTTGITYLETYNDWTPETAKYVDENLESIVDSILNKFGKDKLTEILAGINLYNDGTVNAIMKTLSDALKGLDKIDETLLNLVAKVLGIDFSTVLNYEEDTEYGVTDKDSLLNVLFGEEGLLTPFETFFRFMLLGKDYAYLTSADHAGEDLITVNGAQGYNRGLVPLMEALGVTPPAKSGYASATALVKDAADAILTRLDTILGSDDIITDVLNMLPEVFYFINADGLKVCANNALAALLTLADTVNGIDGINIDLSGLTDILDKLDIAGIAGIVADKTGIEIPAKLISFMQTNRIGSIAAYDSINGIDGYKVDYTDSDRSELITCILSAALETMLHKDNASKVDALIGTDAVSKVLAILTSDVKPTYAAYNWTYNEGLAKSRTYIGYPNNWTEDTAIYVDENLNEFADMIAQAMTDDSGNAYASLQAMLSDKVAIYNDATVNKIAAALKGLAEKIDTALTGAVGTDTAKLIYSIIGVDLTSTLAYTENTAYGVSDKASFISAVKTLLAPFANVLSFLLLDDGYKFFVYAGAAEGKTAGDDILIINGGEGYKKGIVPLLEAIGCDVATADYDSVDALLGDLLTLVCDRFDALLANPVDELLAILPNLIYFINADGLTVSVNNAIAALGSLYTGVLTAIGSEADLDSLVGFPLSDISFDTILALVKDKTGIDAAGPIGDYLKSFNFGDTVSYSSKSGETAYKMTYNAEDERHDMLTIVASLLLEVLDERSNEAAFRGLIGDNAYQVVYNLLNMTEVEAPMNKIAWTHTDKADSGEVIEPLDTSASFNPYGPLFTRDMAQYMADHIQEFVDNIIQLLGIEGKDGKFINSLEDLLNNVVGNSLYTKANLEKIYGYIDGALKKVNDMKGSKHIKEVLKTSIGVDLAAYEGYAVADIAEGDRDAFTAEIIRMVQPLYPALKWLLTDADLAFFTDKHDEDQIVILGAEGYKYGIVPILEAVLCTDVNNGTATFSSTIMTQEEYEAAVAADDNALLTAILNPVFDKLDQVMADPANEMFALIPNLQYFINTNALDTCFKNILNAVYTLTNALEPLTGKIDIIDVLGIKLSDLTLSSIVNALVSNIGTDTLKLDGMNIDKLLKCFNGTLHSYTNSKSGENPAYFMKYAGEAAKADTLAVILQMLLEWIASGDNPAKLKQIVREKVEMSDEGYAYIDKLIDIVAAYCKTPSGTDSILHMLYYIFYAAYNGTTKVANWQKDYNTRLELVAEGQVAASKRDENLGKVAELLDWLFVEYGDGNPDDTGNVYHNYDDDNMGSPAAGKPKGFAPNGFIAFFKQIIEWFKTIFNKIFKH